MYDIQCKSALHTEMWEIYWLETEKMIEEH